MIGMPVFDQRMLAGNAEVPAERGKRGGAKILIAEDQHWMIGERLFNPGGPLGVERLRQVDADGFGAQSLAQRAEVWCHARSFRFFAGEYGPGGSVVAIGRRGRGGNRVRYCRGILQDRYGVFKNIIQRVE